MSWNGIFLVIGISVAILAIIVERSKQSIQAFNNEKFLETIKSYSPSPNEKSHVLLVIAHPDDESMFFSPSVLALTLKPDLFELTILCLSTCNGDKKNTRENELIEAAKALNIPPENVLFGNFEDGMDV